MGLCPLLKAHVVVGAVVGGVYLGATFMAGSYALSYVDRVGRRFGFEYSRVRLWGSLGYASAAAFSDGCSMSRLPSISPWPVSPGCCWCRSFWPPAFVWPSERAAARAITLRDTLALLRQGEFWRFMVLILGVTNLYLVYDQFPFYFSSLFPTPEQGNAMFGYLNAAQIFVEAGGLFVAPLIVRRSERRVACCWLRRS
jgi:OHS family lactose permease-like MFS transporter